MVGEVNGPLAQWDVPAGGVVFKSVLRRAR